MDQGETIMADTILMRSSQGFLLAAAAAAALLAGCSTRLVGGLDEEEANRIISVLEEEGIAAVKTSEVKGRDVSWVVEVGADETASARKILREAGLPKEKRPGMARLLESGGIIPTADEQRNKEAAAIGEELSRTIESIGGVLDAAVLISLPDAPGLAGFGEAQKVESTASVLIRHKGNPSFAVEEIRKLVAGAVAGMKPENVTVVLNRAAKAWAGPKAPSYQKVGPFLVAPSSKNLLVGFIAALLACNLALAGLLIAGALRVFRSRKKAAL
jgi:type III secretion system YscJ/HrcJ family lipoprotein